MDQEFYRDALLEELSRQSGIQIGSLSDCQKISDWLKIKGISISGFTIGRMCGFLENRKTYKSSFNLLAQGIGMHSWDYFVSYHKNLNEDMLLSSQRNHGLNAYTINALELAIRNRDSKGLWAVSTTIESVSDPNIVYLMRFGAAVRSVSQDKDFLQELVKTPAVNTLLFDYFVDEDNPGGYYTYAMEYLKHTSYTSPNLEAFSSVFQFSHEIYRNRFVKEFNSPDWIPTAHFHVKSRILECTILKNPSKKIEGYTTILNRLFEQLEHSTDEAKRWFLARSIRAFAHQGLAKDFLSISFVQKALSKQNGLIQKEINSTADLIIQFTCLAYSIRVQNQIPFGVPRRMLYDHLNENNSRVCIESAILILMNGEHSKLYESLESFAKKSGNTWVLQLLKM